MIFLIKKLSAIILSFLLSLSLVIAIDFPTQDDSIYVNDYADVIDEETEEELISMNQESDYAYGGYVVVVTEDFIDYDLYDYSYQLFNEWGIGDEDNNNGVLLVLDIGNDNYSYIVGTGIEKILTDGEMDTIISEYMEPDFASGDYGEAVLKTTEQFLDAIEDGGFTVDDTSTSSNNTFHFILRILPSLIGIGIIIFLLCYLFRRKRRYY